MEVPHIMTNGDILCSGLIDWSICHISYLPNFLLTSPLLVHYREKHTRWHSCLYTYISTFVWLKASTFSSHTKGVKSWWMLNDTVLHLACQPAKHWHQRTTSHTVCLSGREAPALTGCEILTTLMHHMSLMISHTHKPMFGRGVMFKYSLTVY